MALLQHQGPLLQPPAATALLTRCIPGKGIGTGLSPETAEAGAAEPYRVSDVPEPAWACGRGGFSPPGIRRVTVVPVCMRSSRRVGAVLSLLPPAIPPPQP